MKPGLLDYYTAARDVFGHRCWWPADTAFEVCIGAILTQNTSWKNVEKAINNVRNAGRLDPEALHSLPRGELAELIRPAGYYNVKAGRLAAFLEHLFVRHQGSLDSLLSTPRDELRAELLTVHGIGKETADSIILYAARQVIFVVDAYTRRVTDRHGLIDPKADYDAVRLLFERNLAPDLDLYQDFHAQIVAVGHGYCKTKPRCDACPWKQFLDGNRVD